MVHKNGMCNSVTLSIRVRGLAEWSEIFESNHKINIKTQMWVFTIKLESVKLIHIKTRSNNMKCKKVDAFIFFFKNPNWNELYLQELHQNTRENESFLEKSSLKWMVQELHKKIIVKTVKIHFQAYRKKSPYTPNFKLYFKHDTKISYYYISKC